MTCRIIHFSYSYTDCHFTVWWFSRPLIPDFASDDLLLLLILARAGVWQMWKKHSGRLRFVLLLEYLWRHQVSRFLYLPKSEYSTISVLSQPQPSQLFSILPHTTTFFCHHSSSTPGSSFVKNESGCPCKQSGKPERKQCQNKLQDTSHSAKSVKLVATVKQCFPTVLALVFIAFK